MRVRKIINGFILLLVSSAAFSQDVVMDTSISSLTVIIKDSRINLLGEKMLRYNESLADKIKMVNGYRLMLLNTTDRNLAMQVRGKLIQQFPDQKVYMIFLSPYIKLKMGNFTDKDAADDLRKQLLASKIVSGNVYVFPEKVELKPEKTPPIEE